MKIATVVALAGIAGATLLAACTRDVQALDGPQIEQRYGVPGAYNGSVTTADGPMTGTLVPITLADGTQGHLFIPPKRAGDPHAVYLRDHDGLHPVQLQDRATREEVEHSPSIVERRAEPPHVNKRSWEKEALIIGGSAGAGTGIGALAGGKKGAGIGAAAGGVGGLIFDLMTRDKK
jgi:hypothetical protein